MARAQRLESRQVVVVVGALVVVQPARRSGVGDRRPEVEAVRDGGGGEVVPAREAAAGDGAPYRRRVVGQMCPALPARSISSQAVGSKVSHLVADSPSMRFSFTSPPPVFSSLARTSVTLSVTLPGIPDEKPPSMPDDRVVPSGPSSTVLRQSGCFSSASNEEVNAWSAVGFSPLSGERADWAAATVGAVTTRTSEAAMSAAVRLCLLREPCRGCMPSHSARRSARWTTLSERCTGSSREPSGRRCQGCWTRTAGRIDRIAEIVTPGRGRTGLRYPRGLNSGKTVAQSCIRSCSVGCKWTIPVGVCPAVFHAGGQGGPGERSRGCHGVHPSLDLPNPRCIRLACKISMTQAQLTAVAGPFA